MLKDKFEKYGATNHLNGMPKVFWDGNKLTED